MQNAQDIRSVSSEPALGTHDIHSTEEKVHPRSDNSGGDRDGGSGSGKEEVDSHQKQLPWQPEETAAYVLRWTDDEITKTRINTGAQLRTRLREDGGTPRHLFVVHGLLADHLEPLRDVLGIDTSFFEAHVGRRSYRPLRRKTKAVWAHYDYPELVELPSTPAAVRSSNDQERKKMAPDYVGDAPMFKISAAGEGVVVCRASIWMSEGANVLFLDRPAWERPAGIQRGRYKTYTTTKIPDKEGTYDITMRLDEHGNTTVLGDEIPSLEKVLYENLRDGCSASDDMLELFEELVSSRWGEMFETLGPDAACDGAEMSAMFWQILGSLERNLDSSRQVEKMRYHKFGADGVRKLTCSAAEEWNALISRANRRIQLLTQLKPVVEKIRVPRHPGTEGDVNLFGDDMSPTAVRRPGAGNYGQRYSYNDRPRRRNYYNSNGTSGSPTDEGQRSLNRVAYLGGVLLPFSIVSGVLAIEEPFGPGDGQFWIFWAVTIPLMLLTLGVIYADSIRKAEVWIEVATSSSSSSDTTSESDIRKGDNASESGISYDGSQMFAQGYRRGYFHRRKKRRPDLEQTMSHGGETRMSSPVAMSISMPMRIQPQSRIVESVTIYPENRTAETEIRRIRGSEEATEDEVIEDDREGDARDRRGETEEEEEEEEAEEDRVPDTMVERRWPTMSRLPGINTRTRTGTGLGGDSGDGVRNSPNANRKWRREQLGWAGACATLFQLYKLKKGIPPGHARLDRSSHGSRRTGTGFGPEQTGLRRFKTK